jgi:hypothetical protein
LRILGINDIQRLRRHFLSHATAGESLTPLLMAWDRHVGGAEVRAKEDDI